MSEVTLEVPESYRGGIQSRLVDFRNDALNTVGRAEIGMSDDTPEYVAHERQAAEAVTPLVDQGLAQLQAQSTTYKGSGEWIARALNWRAAAVSEDLHDALDRNDVDHERVREMLQELSWLNDAGERIKGADTKTVAA